MKTRNADGTLNWDGLREWAQERSGQHTRAGQAPVNTLGKGWSSAFVVDDTPESRQTAAQAVLKVRRAGILCGWVVRQFVGQRPQVHVRVRTEDFEAANRVLFPS